MGERYTKRIYKCKSAARRVIRALIALLLCIICASPVFASGHVISSVTIRVSSDLEPGETLPGIDFGTDDKTASSGGITVSMSGTKYYIYDAEWVTSESRTMEVGDKPVMKVYLSPYDTDDYYFKGSYRSSNVTIRNGTFVSASKKGDDLVVKIRVDAIEGEFDPPEEAYWKDNTRGTAKWEEPDENDSGRYEVVLKRGSSKITTIETTAKTYNFYPYMTTAGTYTFRVRTIAKSSSDEEYGKSSEWTESDELYIAEEDVSDGTGISSGTALEVASTSLVGWIYDNGSWFYRYPDGTYLTDGWLQLDDKWYLFGVDGRMLTGWQQRNNQYYYFGSDGVMVTGWLTVDGNMYYLNPTKDSFEGCMFSNCLYTIDGNEYYFLADGSRASGWQEVNGNWCYFYPDTGIQAKDVTINTFYINEDGYWKR